MHPLNTNLKKIRLSKRETQEQFAKRLGIKRSTLAAYEEGRAVPRLTDIQTFITKLGIPDRRVSVFLFGEMATK